jgi:hypothetical protein
MSNQQNAKPAVLMAIALLVAGAGAGFFLLMAGSSDSARVEMVAQPARQMAQPAPLPAPVPQAIESHVEPVAVDPPTPPRDPSSRASRLARDLEREQIWTALGREHKLKPAAPGSAAPSEQEAAQLPTLDREYVREAIKEQLVPVAVDCYNTALQQDPKLGGKLVMNFTIIGVEEVGGVVEEADIDEESTLDSEFVRECLRESLMTVTFEPPPDGGRVTVTYPLTFEPE